jgi:hypothetical protein
MDLNDNIINIILKQCVIKDIVSFSSVSKYHYDLSHKCIPIDIYKCGDHNVLQLELIVRYWKHIKVNIMLEMIPYSSGLINQIHTLNLTYNKPLIYSHIYNRSLNYNYRNIINDTRLRLSLLNNINKLMIYDLYIDIDDIRQLLSTNCCIIEVYQSIVNDITQYTCKTYI